MINYPYYIPAQVDSGVLRKLFKNNKFKTHNDAVQAMTEKYARLADITGYNSFLNTQNVILEYTAEYEGRIVGIYTDGNYTMIDMPQIIM